MEKLPEMVEQMAKDEEARSVKKEPEYRMIMGRNIYNKIPFYRSRNVGRNEMFASGRMAYSYDVSEAQDEIESDIPTMLIRSKADVLQDKEDLHTLTTNFVLFAPRWKRKEEQTAIQRFLYKKK